ncbi:MAG TPA: 4Fe-4S dicluster domain-containing protein [Thermodesulfobacteriota bacterium]|nr:4Fe-4S dicluster domain-containing protein [Thermodesulfobacteriota bacterium]
MEWSRRTFLKVAGTSALGLGFKPALDALAGNAGSKLLKGPSALAAKRWAMAIDLAKCPLSCTDCVAACHETHNVPDFGNPKDEVKWIWREPYGDVFPAQEHKFMGAGWKEKSVIVLCNHCEEPACVRVCPTQATFKRPDGIVMMDYHRCIGCRFCVAGCPYGARSMNFRDPRPFIKKVNPDFPTRTRGVVEKCNFCVERLEQGLPPACVAACQEKALTFGDLENSAAQIRELLRAHFAIRRKPELGTHPQVYYLV